MLSPVRPPKIVRLSIGKRQRFNTRNIRLNIIKELIEFEGRFLQRKLKGRRGGRSMMIHEGSIVREERGGVGRTIG